MGAFQECAENATVHTVWDWAGYVKCVFLCSPASRWKRVLISIIKIVDAAAFVRSTDPSLFPPDEFEENVEDRASGPGAPDLELLSSPFAWKESLPKHPDLPPGPLGSLSAVLLRFVLHAERVSVDD